MSPSRPPEGRSEGRDRPPVVCPHCGSTNVAVESEFGSTLMTRQFYCRGCRTVFEWVKGEDGDPAEWLDA